MEAIFFIVTGIFAALGFLCLLSIVIGLPGNWIMLFLAMVVEFSDRFYLPPGEQQTFSWKIIIACVVLAAIGEALEFGAGMLGAKKGGSSKRGMIGALIGGLGGAVIGIPFPIPFLGSLVGAIVGTFVGAIVGEMSREEVNLDDALKPAAGATVGRILGTMSKLPFGIVIWVSLVAAAFIR